MTASADPLTMRAQARVGQTLRGKWRLERLIGVGGMAAVYAATHRNGMRGAVKMLHVEVSAHEEARGRFLREGYVANKVDHPGTVRVLDDDTADDGSVFLVMELLEGETVDARAAARGGRLDAAEVVAIADDLLDVLASAHEKGIVHRDLKPENLFLTTRGELKVLDFGIARLRELSAAGSASATSTGAAMGTPAFMPPEQAQGRWDIVDARTDLWAVGASMFSLLTGRYVHHEAETLQLLMLAAMTKPAQPLASAAPGVPPPVCAIVDKALAFDPANRWPNARAMQAAAREARGLAPRSINVAAPSPAHAPTVSASQLGFIASTDARTAAPVSKDPVGAPARSVGAIRIAAALLGIVVAGAIGLYAWSSSRSSPAPTPYVAAQAEPSPPATAAPTAAAPVAPPAPEPSSSAVAVVVASAAPPPPPTRAGGRPAPIARSLAPTATATAVVPPPSPTPAPPPTAKPSIFEGRQ